jgi:hypothetical protein
MARMAGEMYEPSGAMAIAARGGLQLQARYGRGESKHRLIRAKKIAQQQPLSESDWRSIASFHARNYGNQDPLVLSPYPDGSPDARYIAAQLLGGSAGKEMSMDLISKLNIN